MNSNFSFVLPLLSALIVVATGSTVLLVILLYIKYKISRRPEDKSIYSIYEVHVARDNEYISCYKVRAFSFLHAVTKVSNKHYKKDFSVVYSFKKDVFN